MTLAISIGILNAQAATCGSQCTNCCGYSSFIVTPNPGYCAMGLTAQCGAYATYCTGQVDSFTASSSWSSSDTSILTVNGGLVTGVSAGTANVTALFPSIIPYTGTVCNPSSPPPCPTGTPAPSGPVKVQRPTSLSVAAQSLASVLQCSSTQYGVTAKITYQVLDQDGVAIKSSSMEPQEKVVNDVFNGVPRPDPAPDWTGFPANAEGASKFTDSNGQFKDAPLGSCNDIAFTETATQTFSVLVNATRYPASGALRTNSLTFTGPGPATGHGRVCNGSGSTCAGADFDVSR